MRERVARVPLVAVLVGAVLTLASALLVFVGGRATGVSWDEPYRIGKLVNYLQSGWFVDDIADGQPLDFNAFVYAPVADLLSHAFGVGPVVRRVELVCKRQLDCDTGPSLFSRTEATELHRAVALESRRRPTATAALEPVGVLSEGEV